MDSDNIFPIIANYLSFNAAAISIYKHLNILPSHTLAAWLLEHHDLSYRKTIQAAVIQGNSEVLYHFSDNNQKMLDANLGHILRALIYSADQKAVVQWLFSRFKHTLVLTELFMLGRFVARRVARLIRAFGGLIDVSDVYFAVVQAARKRRISCGGVYNIIRPATLVSSEIREATICLILMISQCDCSVLFQ